MEDMLGRMWALEPKIARSLHIEVAKNGMAGLMAMVSENQLTRKHAYLSEMKADGAVANLAANNNNTAGTADNRYVLVVPVMGVMTRYGGACSYGTEDMSQWLKDADKNPNIAGILLEMESGGGEVNGTQQLGDVIAGIKKPVGAFVKGMAASAAYWAASAADFIMMEKGPVSEVGSIGVLMVHGELATHETRNGVKWTLIRAEGSESKALMNPYEPISEELIATAKAEMKPMRDQFVKTVKKNRAGKLSEDEGEITRIFSGEMFGAKEAIKLGLADSAGSFIDALKAVWDMRKK